MYECVCVCVFVCVYVCGVSWMVRGTLSAQALSIPTLAAITITWHPSQTQTNGNLYGLWLPSYLNCGDNIIIITFMSISTTSIFSFSLLILFILTFLVLLMFAVCQILAPGWRDDVSIVFRLEQLWIRTATTKVDTRGNISTKLTQLCAFADDMVIIARSPNTLTFRRLMLPIVDVPHR